ncbi:hypothetical protein GGS24DRAFT_487696 [Hypoxylon argillaceum]|nr:hypothetical protein GGS24DRAFT_487696 [Hypoxylon argillaceum]
MTQREIVGMNRTNVLETYYGTIQVGNRWPRKNQNRGPPDLPGNFRVSKRVRKCLDSLQVLQFKRNQYLLGETLAVPLQFLHDSLPYMVQRDVNIFEPVSEDIWAKAFSGELDRLEPQELDRFIARHEVALPRKKYHFWPVDVNKLGGDGDHPHWALIVLHIICRPELEVDDPDVPPDELSGPYNFLDTYAVITPNHGAKARALEDDIANMLLTLLPEMDIKVGAKTIREYPWTSRLNAPQLMTSGSKGHWSTGLRVFEMIRVWLDRITEAYCKNPYVHDPIKFWEAHPGWFNPDAVRSNMIGIAAAMVNKAMDSTTRVAIEPILDLQMQNSQTGEVVLAQKMAPSRRQTGAFISGQPRSSPTWIEDTPLDDSESINASPDTDEGEEDEEDEELEEEVEEEVEVVMEEDADDDEEENEEESEDGDEGEDDDGEEEGESEDDE